MQRRPRFMHNSRLGDVGDFLFGESEKILAALPFKSIFFEEMERGDWFEFVEFVFKIWFCSKLMLVFRYVFPVPVVFAKDRGADLI